MKKRILMIGLVLLLMVGVSLGTWAIAATTGYGSSSDPLITMSYVNNTLTPSVMSQFQKQLDSKVSDLTASYQKQIQDLQDKLNQSSSQSSSFVQVNLQNGQSISCSAGTEIMLRSGSAQAWSDMSDLTSGSTLKLGDTLKQNYMYVTPYDGGGLGATSVSSLLIRGTYKVST